MKGQTEGGTKMIEAAWYVEAKTLCAQEGHPHYVDGRCVRCRAYDPEELIERELRPIVIGVAPVQCSHYTRDQGCPMHGET